MIGRITIIMTILLAGCNPAEKVWRDAVIVQGKNEIALRFTYPSTVVFREAFYNDGGWVPVVCGEVDAQKVEGVRIGFQRFIAPRLRPNLLESDVFPVAFMPESITSFDEAWEWACN